MSNTLRREDWDFSGVPEAELHRRMHKEYADESPTLRQIKDEIMNGRKLSPALEEIDRSLKKSIFGSKQSREWLTEEFGILHAIRTSNWAEARETFARAQREEPNFIYADGDMPPRSEPHVEPTGYWQWDRQLSTDDLQGFVWVEGAAVHTIALHWRNYTDHQIIEQFDRWLKKNRPLDCPNPVVSRGKGKKCNDRSALLWLGTLRALNSYTYAHPKFPQELKRGGEKDVYRRKKAAIRHFRKLFPFLPTAELPISAYRKSGRKTK